MRFLFPIFLAGAAAVAVPVLLHLARRRTRRELPFSTLMFLTPSLPRFQRRQRIEHWALLALRVLGILLLAAAFARPFVPRPVPALSARAGGRTVVLLDTSASMRRRGLWDEALGRLRAVLGRAGAGDRVAVLTFDRRPATVLGFDQWAALAPGERAGAVLSHLAGVEPGWGGTDLGRALMAAAEAVIDDEGEQGQGGARVVVVSDLQQGSRLDALSASDWPARIQLVLEPLRAAGSNASLHALADPGGEGPAALRVRVTNHEGSNEKFTLRWADNAGSVPVTVRPGQSRVVEAPRGRADAPGTLVLEGDDQDFDDHLAVAPPLPAPVRILFVGGPDPGDSSRPLFYLKRAFPVTRLRAPEITVVRPDALAAIDPAVQLVVVTEPPGPAGEAALRAHLARGRAALVAVERPAALLGALTGAPAPSVTEATGDYALLTSVDLAHPALAPFSDPRFGDFTKIRFWKHRRIDERALRGARVLARFDDGAPAWLTLPVGRGSLTLMTSGWQPADSQLALSSKFVPLLHGILETSAGLDSGRSQFLVGDMVTLPAGGGKWRVRTPGGVVDVPAGATTFTETDRPGMYALENAGAAGPPRPFAVNLDPAESATAPLPPEALERLGLGTRPEALAPAAAAQAHALSFYTALERDQALWRWLVVAVLLILLVETWLAPRTAPARVKREAA